MFSTECPLISPIVPSSGSTCFNNGIFQNITISFCLWVHRTLQAPLTFCQFSWFNCLANILSRWMLSVFCKLAKIRRRCCSRILWHFQDFSWVSYLCSSWLQPPLLQKGCCAKTQAEWRPSAKTQGFPLFAKLQNYPQQVLSAFYSCSLSTSSPNVSSELTKVQWESLKMFFTQIPLLSCIIFDTCSTCNDAMMVLSRVLFLVACAWSHQ